MNIIKDSCIIGIGTDLIEIARILAAYKRYGNVFLNRVFTDTELQYCFSKKYPYASLAVRFAAKEAVAKAFRTGIGSQIGWKCICIDLGIQGEPVVASSLKLDRLLKELQAHSVHISLSHTRELAQAVAMVVS